MTDHSKQLNRNHFRAPISARTTAVLVEDGSRVYVRKHIDIAGIGDVIKGNDNAIGPVISSLVTVLHHIDEKLDRIIEKLEEKVVGGHDVEVLETVDISGSGISLILSRPLAKGDTLKLSITLPGFPYGRLETLGRVVRLEEIEEKGGTLFKAGIEFIGLGEDEKERLVQYTFSQQRRQIRATGSLEK
jgi:hypothetical protein